MVPTGGANGDEEPEVLSIAADLLVHGVSGPAALDEPEAETWRQQARRAGRLLGVPVRTFHTEGRVVAYNLAGWEVHPDEPSEAALRRDNLGAAEDLRPHGADEQTAPARTLHEEVARRSIPIHDVLARLHRHRGQPDYRELRAAFAQVTGIPEEWLGRLVASRFGPEVAPDGNADG